MKSLFPFFAVTDDVVVRAAVSFLPDQSQPANSRWFWAYHVRIENEGDEPVQLLSRRWSITDGRGEIQHVEGEGVIGEQPVIHPGASYDYVSGCPLATPTGVMEGHYNMVAADGRMLRVAIPRFALVAPSEE
ncbi:MAG: Co2+/Mg2+ efflux protein ApaG [Sphingobium sp.]|nr:Co2+/Mg2+ efflux protein ApaG [Sphingobium sp.]